MTNTTTTPTEQTVREWLRGLDEPEWLRSRRVDAWRQYETMAMPTGLEEEWRRTDISGLDVDGALSRFGQTPAHGVALPAGLHATDGAAGLLVQQDGATLKRWVADSLDPRVLFLDLSEAARTHEDLVRAHLHSLVQPTEWKLQALQAALWSGGALVYVPRGVEVALPLHLVTFGAPAGGPMFPHLLVIADEGSSVTIIQETASVSGAEQSLVSGAVEIVQKRDSRVRWFEMQRWGANTYNFTTVRARLDQGAHLMTCNIGLGGRLTKAKIEAILEGEGSQVALVGLTFGDERQHFDYNTLQDHLAPKTTSDLLYKAALTGRASEVWYGTVRIHKGATGSDANQTSRNMLLSETAKAAPIPVLEIEQYDILRCSHGATAGPVDEEQLFYLESRGIERAEAERMLVDAFFQEVLDRIPDETVRQRVQLALVEKLEKSAT